MELASYRARQSQLSDAIDDARTRMRALDMLRDEMERDDHEAQEWVDSFALDAAGVTGVSMAVGALRDDAIAHGASVRMALDDAISTQKKAMRDAEHRLDELEAEWRKEAEGE